MQKKYRNLLKDTVIFGLGNIGSKLIVFFLVPFYTYYLSPDEYGISDLVFTVSQLAIPFLSLVIFDAVIRFALSRKERPQDVLLIGLYVWAIGSVIAFLLTPLFGLYHTISEWKWYITVYISANILVSVELNYLKAINKNIQYSIICVLQTLSLALMNILLVAHVRLGIKGYLISYIVSNVFAAALTFFAGRYLKEISKAKYDKKLAKEMITYSSPLILNNLSWWVIQSSDKLMLESMISSTALGLYTVASRIPSLITVFITIFQQAWGISSIKEMDSSNDRHFYSNVFNYLSFTAFLGGISLCTIIKPFMDLYIRSLEYGDVWRYVPLLLASAVFSAIAAYCGSMYGALKKSMNNMLTTLVAAIVNIFVNYITILYAGIWGAMIGTVTAYALLAFVRLYDLKKYIAFDIDWNRLTINSILLLIQSIVVSSVSVAIGIIVSIIVLIAFMLINHNELKSLIKKRRNKNV